MVLTSAEGQQRCWEVQRRLTVGGKEPRTGMRLLLGLHETCTVKGQMQAKKLYSGSTKSRAQQKRLETQMTDMVAVGCPRSKETSATWTLALLTEEMRCKNGTNPLRPQQPVIPHKNPGHPVLKTSHSKAVRYQ